MLPAAIYGVLQEHVYADSDPVPAVFGMALSPIRHMKSSLNGFFARAYYLERERHIVVAFRGTETNRDSGIQDVLTDVINVGVRALGTKSSVPVLGVMPYVVGGAALDSVMGAMGVSQFESAIDFFKSVKRSSAGRVITVCGHSLGGCLAALVSMEFNVMCATFNRPAMSEGMLATVAIPRNAGSGLLHDFVATDDPCFNWTKRFLGGDFTGGRIIRVQTGKGHSSDAMRAYLLNERRGRIAPQLWD